MSIFGDQGFKLDHLDGNFLLNFVLVASYGNFLMRLYLMCFFFRWIKSMLGFVRVMLVTCGKTQYSLISYRNMAKNYYIDFICSHIPIHIVALVLSFISFCLCNGFRAFALAVPSIFPFNGFFM